MALIYILLILQKIPTAKGGGKIVRQIRQRGKFLCLPMLMGCII
jgi:hypothetical protein